MKVALALVVLCLAMAQSDAFFAGRGIIGRGFGLGFGRFGLGMGFGWGAPWRFGLGPWAWGGLGPWGLGGLAVPPVGIAPVGVAPAVIGKRDTDSIIKTALVAPVVNKTVCSYSSKRNLLSCEGATFNFECDTVPQLVDINTIRAHNLTVVPDVTRVDNVFHPIFRLFSRTEGILNNYSVVDKADKRIVFSVYNNEKLGKETGIRIKDAECWTAFIRMVKEVVPQTVCFNFFVDTVVKA